MTQQFIALVVVVFFITRLYIEKRKKQISLSEFLFWFIFWLLAGAAISLVKEIDHLAAYFGFSSSGIMIILYVGFLILVYIVFRLRIKIEKIERDISELNRNIALSDRYK
jgi:hypothetical protein